MVLWLTYLVAWLFMVGFTWLIRLKFVCWVGICLFDVLTYWLIGGLIVLPVGLLVDCLLVCLVCFVFIYLWLICLLWVLFGCWLFCVFGCFCLHGVLGFAIAFFVLIVVTLQLVCFAIGLGLWFVVCADLLRGFVGFRYLLDFVIDLLLFGLMFGGCFRIVWVFGFEFKLFRLYVLFV